MARMRPAAACLVPVKLQGKGAGVSRSESANTAGEMRPKRPGWAFNRLLLLALQTHRKVVSHPAHACDEEAGPVELEDNQVFPPRPLACQLQHEP